MDKTLQKPDPNEAYAGPGPVVTALGYAEKYGIWGNVVGAVVGFLGSEGITRITPSYVDKAARLLAKIGIENKGKLAIRIGGGLIGFVTGHYAGFAYGAYKERGRGGEAKNQFDRIKSERDHALDKVDKLEATLAEQAENTPPERAAHFSEKHIPHTEHGGHAAAHKHAADAAEHTRG
jgi:hypothetical protein